MAEEEVEEEGGRTRRVRTPLEPSLTIWVRKNGERETRDWTTADGCVSKVNPERQKERR